MNKYLLSIKAIVLSCTACMGQKVTLINSTEQCWSGGIAGRHGCNYTFALSFEDRSSTLVPDSIWIGEKPIRLTVTDKVNNIQGNTTITFTKSSTRIDITAGTHFDDYADRFGNGPVEPGQTTPKAPKPPITYKGVALIGYTISGKRKYFTVTEIREKYPHRSYP